MLGVGVLGFWGFSSISPLPPATRTQWSPHFPTSPPPPATRTQWSPPATRTKWSPHTLHPTPYTPHPTPHFL
ncbi:MAG: hypothetical protein O9338_00200 [Microcystis sp. LE19-251.1A]|nr:hypothetical protein [Microcystis sp. LE19-251.1A]